ncbi:MAG TPA: hypothetical protein VFY39_04575 [Gammaproteobacteria bacterium]|nr:hypothetical protein [Gammaproteobacteria bacterium]
MNEPVRNQLGEHAEALIADVLDKREKAVVNAVLARLNSGEALDPQFAVQQWLALAEQRRLRTALINRSRVENARAERST